VVVFVGLRIAHELDRAFDADLPFQRLPMEAQGRVGILAKLHSLAAFEVSVEDESPLIDSLQEDHADRRNARSIGGRERHGVGIFGLRFFRIGHPSTEQAEGIVRI
jgi:hypothetical protein